MPVIASDSTYGSEEQQSEDRAPGKAPIEQDSEPERERDLEEEGQDDDQHVVAHRLPEHVARQGHLVVLEPDEVFERPEAVPLVQAEMGGLDDRDDDEDEIERQRGQQEEADRQPLPGQPRTRAGPGAFGSQHVPACLRRNGRAG